MTIISENNQSEIEEIAAGYPPAAIVFRLNVLV